MSFLKSSFFKKLFFFSILFACFVLGVYLVKTGSSVPFPTRQNPISFFASQTRHDLKLTFVEAIQKARQKITLSIFTLYDDHLIAWLNKKAKEGVEVTCYFDREHNKNLAGRLHPQIKKIAYQNAGLMHRKILIIDEHLTLIGSCNWTKNSLHQDDNLVCLIELDDLATWLEKHLTHYSIKEKFYSSGGEFSCYLMPDKKRIALEKLIKILENAEEKIEIAMFSFTHPEIIKALLKAKKRGVSVEIFLDKQMKSQTSLTKQPGYLELKSSIYYGSRPFLLHHKCALIDDKIFIMGSTNWTVSGFLKNQDLLLFFEDLEPKQLHYLHSLFKTIRIENS